MSNNSVKTDVQDRECAARTLNPATAYLRRYTALGAGGWMLFRLPAILSPNEGC